MPYLKSISITSLRNIRQQKLEFSDAVNLIYGENGSGKTSLLEALSLLAMGRSFRSHKIRPVIHHEAKEVTLFAELKEQSALMRIGLQKAPNKKTDIRINGEPVQLVSELANLIPLKVIDANAFQLLEGSPQQRRQFLDWMVFHVKPEFNSLWQRASRVLKQRNSLLRHDKIDVDALQAWDLELVHLAEAMHQHRLAVFEDFIPWLMREASRFFDTQNYDLDISYEPGWSLDQGLSQILEQERFRDQRDGYTHKGPHRADLRIKVNGSFATDLLSRGQIKSLVSMMHIASARYFQSQKKIRLVFLLDDLLAELDSNNAKSLLEHLLALDTQLFITAIDQEALLGLFNKGQGYKLFHVKQGEISAIED